MSNKKQLCVVFDIDETLIQFVQSKYKQLWVNLDPSIKQKYNGVDFGDNVVILRPNIEKLFQYFKNTPDIKVGLWTYSEREYAEDIADILSKLLNLPESFFMFKWGAEDMDLTEDGEASGLPKDLTNVYNKFPNFNKFNTFLVDDLYKNISHRINKQNCILVQPFAPFGTSKVRQNMSQETHNKLTNDTIFNDLIQICQKVLTDIKNCDDEDIDDAFKTEPVFDTKRVKRMNLGEFYKTYATHFLQMMTIGSPMEAKEFIMVNTDNYNVHVKGGKHKKSHKNKQQRKKSTRRKLNKIKIKI